MLLAYRLFALPIVAIAIAASAHAQYHITTIDVPNARTFVGDINDAGEVAGYGEGATTYTAFHAQADGTGYTTFDRTGAAFLGASGINTKGEISGASVDFALTDTGFVRHLDGTFETIDPSTGGLPSMTAEAIDLNNDDTVVGFYNETKRGPDDKGLASHGFRRENGVYETLDFPGTGNHGTQLYSVNDAGVASGRYLDASGNSHGFLYSDALGYVDTSIPGFAYTENGGLANDGDFIEDAYVDFGGMPHSYPLSFVYTGGTFVPFAVPGAFATVATGINDSGQIVGTYVDFDQTGNLVYHGFAATPVPEPSALAALGLGALALLRRRRA